MILLLSASLCLSLLIGFLFACLTLPGRQACLPDRQACALGFLLRSSLAVGLGIGFCSLLYFVWLLIFGPAGKGFFLFETGLAVCLIAVLIYAKSRDGSSTLFSDSPCAVRGSWLSRFIAISFYIALTSAVFIAIYLMLSRPHGLWDAWSIWNMRARFIFRAGQGWTNAFSNLLFWSHPDYPLLLPAAVVRSWRYIGHEAQAVPMAISILFCFAITGLLFSSVSGLRSRNQGFLAAMVLLATPLFVASGAAQYADLPLSFFFLATIVLLCLYDRSGDNRTLLILAGLTAGLSAWAKNEGILFMLSVVIARAISVVTQKGWRDFFRQMRSFITGLIPVLIILVCFKVKLAPANDLFPPGTDYNIILGRVLDGSRYLMILKAFWLEVIHFGAAGFSIILLLLMYLLFMGGEVKKKGAGVITSVLILSMMAAGYFAIYLITPRMLAWHLRSSFDRLILQLWPVFIFVYFMIIKTPEERGVI
ncbi:MAG: glycosyltransferase family 39 protein [Candidatus Omnitrophica bacterium]|nr:glycosyltransferase family 39 protein [Candidatus Omnitrophota bacterium]